MLARACRSRGAMSPFQDRAKFQSAVLLICIVANHGRVEAQPFSLIAGPDLDVNAASTRNPSVSALDSTTAIVCYEDRDDSYHGTCNVLTRSGTLLSAGADLDVNAAMTSAPSVAALDSTTAIVCYGDDSIGGHGTCNVLTRSGTTLSAGADLDVNAATTSTPSVSALDSTTAIVCYEDDGPWANQHGTCNVLTRSGTTLSAGADLVVNAASTSTPSVLALDSTTAIVCYVGSWAVGNHGTCNVLTRSGTTLSAGADLDVNAGSTRHPSVSALDSTTAIVCYRDGDDSDHGTCNLLDKVVSPAPPSPPASPPFLPPSLPPGGPMEFLRNRVFGKTWGDPHLNFGNGGQADFRGLHEHIFNFVSAVNFTVNVLTQATDFVRWGGQLVHGSFITKLFVKIRSPRTGKLVRAACVASQYASFRVFAADNSTEYHNLTRVEMDGVEVLQLSGGRFVAHGAGWEVFVNRRRLRKPVLVHSKVEVPKDSSSRWFLDISFHLLEEEGDTKKFGQATLDRIAPHGIVGQSFDGSRIAVSGKQVCVPHSSPTATCCPPPLPLCHCSHMKRTVGRTSTEMPRSSPQLHKQRVPSKAPLQITSCPLLLPPPSSMTASMRKAQWRRATSPSLQESRLRPSQVQQTLPAPQSSMVLSEVYPDQEDLITPHSKPLTQMAVGRCVFCSATTATSSGASRTQMHGGPGAQMCRPSSQRAALASRVFPPWGSNRGLCLTCGIGSLSAAPRRSTESWLYLYNMTFGATYVWSVLV